MVPYFYVAHGNTRWGVQFWDAFVRNKGGTRNKNGGYERSRWDLSIGKLLGVCTLYLLSIEDRSSLGFSTDGARTTVGTRYVCYYFCVGIFRGAPGISFKACRDTLTNRPIWTEIYGTLVYQYEYLTLIYSDPAVLFSDATCIYFPTPGEPGMSYVQSPDVTRWQLCRSKRKYRDSV